MFWRRSATSDEPAAAAAPAAPAALAVKPAKLLVIQSDKYDWVRIFRGATLADGRAVEVCQCGWDGLKVAAEPQSREPLICHVRRVVPDERGKLVPAQKLVTFTPDFVLVRNEVFSPRADYRNQLYGLMYGGVEGVNSLLSLTLFAERALIGARRRDSSSSLSSSSRRGPSHATYRATSLYRVRVAFHLAHVWRQISPPSCLHISSLESSRRVHL